MRDGVMLDNRVFMNFDRLCRMVKSRLKEDCVSAISLWGAGKNGRLLMGLFAVENIEVKAVFDDYSSGALNGIPIAPFSEEAACGYPVFLTLDPECSAFKVMEDQLKEAKLPYYTLLDFVAHREEKKPAVLEKKHIAQEDESSDGPVIHRAVSAKHREYRDYRIERFKNVHEGERCVIMGNGPSLAKTDFSLLRQERCFGLNKIFLMFDKTDFRPDYICCYVKDVISQCKEQFLALEGIPLFLSHESLDVMPPGLDHIYHLGPQKRFSFSQDVVHDVYGGFTVTYVAIQLAVYMGFKEIVLIGVDHNFAGYDGDPSKWHKIDEPKATHFDPNYFASGQYWQAPDYRMIETHFAYAKGVCEHLGVRILDATDGGKLQVFEKCSLNDALHRQD